MNAGLMKYRETMEIGEKKENSKERGRNKVKLRIKRRIDLNIGPIPGRDK